VARTHQSRGEVTGTGFQTWRLACGRAGRLGGCTHHSGLVCCLPVWGRGGGHLVGSARGSRHPALSSAAAAGGAATATRGAPGHGSGPLKSQPALVGRPCHAGRSQLRLQGCYTGPFPGGGGLSQRRASRSPWGSRSVLQHAQLRAPCAHRAWAPSMPPAGASHANGLSKAAGTGAAGTGAGPSSSPSSDGAAGAAAASGTPPSQLLPRGSPAAKQPCCWLTGLVLATTAATTTPATPPTPPAASCLISTPRPLRPASRAVAPSAARATSGTAHHHGCSSRPGTAHPTGLPPSPHCRALASKACQGMTCGAWLPGSPGSAAASAPAPAAGGGASTPAGPCWVAAAACGCPSAGAGGGASPGPAACAPPPVPAAGPACPAWAPSWSSCSASQLTGSSLAGEEGLQGAWGGKQGGGGRQVEASRAAEGRPADSSPGLTAGPARLATAGLGRTGGLPPGACLRHWGHRKSPTAAMQAVHVWHKEWPHAGNRRGKRSIELKASKHTAQAGGGALRSGREGGSASQGRAVLERHEGARPAAPCGDGALHEGRAA